MSSRKKSDAGFLMQGSILAVASIISRIVGLIYRVPLTAIIGKTGNDYYGTAYEIYNIILLISSYSIPLAVSKLVSARMSKGHVADAFKVLRGALCFAVISGGLATTILLVFADVFTGMLKTPLATIALRVLAPTIFIVAVLGVFRGFFQGLHTTIPSAMSQILEQIVNAIVSVTAAFMLYNYGRKVGAVLADESKYAAAYGAAGGTLGTCIGALFGLFFVLFVYFAFRKSFVRRVKKDRHRPRESYSEIFSVLVMTIIPVLLSTTVYNISSIIDQGIFKNIAVLQGYDSALISEWWGVYSGQFKVLINVPISIASALAASAVPSLTAAYQSKNYASVKNQINLAQRFIMVIAFPCFIGMAVLSQPLMMLLFKDTDKTSGYMMIVGAISIVFYSLSTLSNGLLQGIDKLRIPVRNAVLALFGNVLMLLLLMEAFHLNIYAVVLANAFYALCMCFLNGFSVARYSGARMDIKLAVVIPALSSVIMGLFVFGAYKLVMAVVSSNALATFVGIVVGVFVYFVTLILLKGMTEEELLSFPKGRVLVKIAKKLHLM